MTTTQALPAFVGPEGLAADTEEPFAPEFQLSEAMDYDDELAKPWEIAVRERAASAYCTLRIAVTLQCCFGSCGTMCAACNLVWC